MNINKMTEKLQQGLVNAQSLATSLNHQEIDTAHLLSSLLQDSEGLASRICEARVSRSRDCKRFKTDFK